MVDKKISALTELTTAVDADMLAIVDTTAAPDETKKITKVNLLKAANNIAEGRAKSATVTYLSIPGIEPSGSSTSALAANRIYYEPILVVTAITLDQIVIEVGPAGAASTTARLGIYNANADWQPTTLVLDAGTVAVDSVGIKTITINQALPAGRYLLAVWSNGAPSLRFARGGNRYAGYNNALGSNAFIIAMYKDSTYGTYPDPGTAWDTVAVLSAPLQHFVFVRVSTP